MFFGKFVLGENVTGKTWVATLVICVGNMLIVYYSNRDSKEYTAKEVSHLILARSLSLFLFSRHSAAPPTLTLWPPLQLFNAYAQDYKWYCLAMAILLFIVQKIYNCFKSMSETKSRMADYVPNWYKTTQAVCYALFSAILGTQQMLQAKCLSELLRMTGEVLATGRFMWYSQERTTSVSRTFVVMSRCW